MSSKAFTSERELKDGKTLVFITDRKETVCLCEEIEYCKIVARHESSRQTLKQLHESVEHLFDQYVVDAERQYHTS